MKKQKKRVNSRYSVLLFFLLSTMFALNAQGSGKDISGKVVDESGMPLPGANIVVKDSNIGTITDFDGLFQLNVPEGTEMVQVSMVGFKTIDVLLDGKTQFNIVLPEDVSQLSEVVLIGYGGARKKEDLTGSVGVLSSKDFEDQPVTRVEQALSGRSAGVQVKTNSGAPGGNLSIRIRGANSITGNNQPLIVIDGVIGANFQLVNPNDIESIQVLKDASSTAIYGSRGANGVVIVSTKSGRNKKPVISFNTFQSISTLPKKIDYLNAAEFAELYNSYDRDLNFVPGVYVPPFSDEDIERYENEGGTDWQDELFREAISKSYQLSVGGGGEKVNYYISGEYLDQEGIVVNSSFQRYNLRSKVEVALTDKLDLTLNMGWSKLKGKNNEDVGHQLGAIGRLPQWVAIEPVWEDYGVLYNNTPQYGAVSGNPVGLQYAYISQNETSIFQPSFNLSYKILEGLSAKLFGSYEGTKTTVYNLENNHILDAGPEVISRASINNIDRERGQVNFIVDYTKEFGDHNIQATAIYESGNYIEKGNFNGANGLNDVSLGWNNLSLSESQTSSSYYYDEYYNSLALRVNYGYLDRYLFTATVRRDGVSKFHGDNRFSTFPSLAFAWNAGKEAFVQDLDVFSSLKFRASWGDSGSHAIGSYATLPYFIQNGESNYHPNGPGTGTYVGLGVGAPGNESLKWETTTQYDVGIEMGFFNNRLSLEADYYNKDTNDLLVNTLLPEYLGGETVLKNVGSINNKGFEFTVNANPIRNDFFTWDVSANISVNRNEVVDLGGDELVLSSALYGDSATPITAIQLGQPLGSFYGYNFQGVWKSTEAAEAATFGNVPGDARYEDINNDGEIDSEDLSVIGNAQPDFIFGFSNTMKFGNLDFSFVLTGQKGGETFNGIYQKSVGLYGQSRAFTSPEWYNRWRPGHEDTDVPAFSSTSQSYPNSSRWLEDASFLRIQNITLAYNLKKEFITDLGLSEFQVYINAENVHTWTNYSSYNPDISSAGRSTGGGSGTDVDQNIDTGAYPIPRTFTLGLKVKF
ncbi:SusC/RagA family TonB-linked outer membrane protein [Winogradskyella sediminis]|uniref:SusC/RagA family TonB-linked outer membrane protein n=1 Tax=Winogradskyella sediminis TaxID=1382466 RepID=UPI003AA86325